MMIRGCTEVDFSIILEIINDAAQAYQGVIPEDCWNSPYMSSEELRHEIEDGIVFWGLEKNGQILGVMGIQDKGDCTLIRHAYIRTQSQKMGVGTKLLGHLESITREPVMIGTWMAASWAISFYEKNGYSLVSGEEKNILLDKYWSIPTRQMETSVVLVKHQLKKA